MPRHKALPRVHVSLNEIKFALVESYSCLSMQECFVFLAGSSAGPVWKQKGSQK